ncbi:hypothetical protein RsoM2USA_205 [Ralstonia phage RsoM2USA]|nr:hypothetical protein RsoM2USA_205 [Ralstonia phage RsoM2USA]
MLKTGTLASWIESNNLQIQGDDALPFSPRIGSIPFVESTQFLDDDTFTRFPTDQFATNLFKEGFDFRIIIAVNTFCFHQLVIGFLLRESIDYCQNIFSTVFLNAIPLLSFPCIERHHVKYIESLLKLCFSSFRFGFGIQCAREIRTKNFTIQNERLADNLLQHDEVFIKETFKMRMYQTTTRVMDNFARVYDGDGAKTIMFALGATREFPFVVVIDFFCQHDVKSRNSIWVNLVVGVTRETCFRILTQNSSQERSSFFGIKSKRLGDSSLCCIPAKLFVMQFVENSQQSFTIIHINVCMLLNSIPFPHVKDTIRVKKIPEKLLRNRTQVLQKFLLNGLLVGFFNGLQSGSKMFHYS